MNTYPGVPAKPHLGHGSSYLLRDFEGRLRCFLLSIHEDDVRKPEALIATYKHDATLSKLRWACHDAGVAQRDT
jgi:hypothetical protein